MGTRVTINYGPGGYDAQQGGNVLSTHTVATVDSAAADGTTDDTAAIQAAIDSGANEIIGDGRLFAVASLNIPSNVTFRDFRLRTIPGSVNGRSPVTVGAYYDTQVRSGITLHNVHVDGQRALQTSISGAEDGARHGFRILGPVENLTMRGCTARNCASDGLILYRGVGVDAVRSFDAGIKKRITITDCDFSGNRRHGVSGECLETVSFVRTTATGNGLDVGASEGEQGARSSGLTYGCGFTFEEYDERDYMADVTFNRCEGTGNARQGLLVYAGPSDAAHASWVPRPGWTLNRSTFDPGDGDAGVEFTPAAGKAASGLYYDDITLTDCDVTGYVRLRACGTTDISGGSIATGKSWCGVADHSGPITVAADVDRDGKAFYEDTSAVAYL